MAVLAAGEGRGWLAKRGLEREAKDVVEAAGGGGLAELLLRRKWGFAPWLRDKEAAVIMGGGGFLSSLSRCGGGSLGALLARMWAGIVWTPDILACGDELSSGSSSSSAAAESESMLSTESLRRSLESVSGLTTSGSLGGWKWPVWRGEGDGMGGEELPDVKGIGEILGRSY